MCRPKLHEAHLRGVFYAKSSYKRKRTEATTRFVAPNTIISVRRLAVPDRECLVENLLSSASRRHSPWGSIQDLAVGENLCYGISWYSFRERMRASAAPCDFLSCPGPTLTGGLQRSFYTYMWYSLIYMCMYSGFVLSMCETVHPYICTSRLQYSERESL